MDPDLLRWCRSFREVRQVRLGEAPGCSHAVRVSLGEGEGEGDSYYRQMRIITPQKNDLYLRGYSHPVRESPLERRGKKGKRGG